MTQTVFQMPLTDLQVKLDCTMLTLTHHTSIKVNTTSVSTTQPGTLSTKPMKHSTQRRLLTKHLSQPTTQTLRHIKMLLLRMQLRQLLSHQLSHAHQVSQMSTILLLSLLIKIHSLVLKQTLRQQEPTTTTRMSLSTEPIMILVIVQTKIPEDGEESLPSLMVTMIPGLIKHSPQTTVLDTFSEDLVKDQTTCQVWRYHSSLTKVHPLMPS
jgi:hypothetical protein